MTTKPKQLIIDTKIRDTSADQFARFILRLLNAFWTFLLVLSFWPVGLAWAVVSVVVMVKLARKRRERYSRNAVALLPQLGAS